MKVSEEGDSDFQYTFISNLLGKVTALLNQNADKFINKNNLLAMKGLL